MKPQTQSITEAKKGREPLSETIEENWPNCTKNCQIPQDCDKSCKGNKKQEI